jgi:sec-independent protein translocase protein TatC
MAKNSTGEMPFLDHLEELRWRIIWSIGALAVGLGIGFFIVVKLNLLTVLQQPIAPFMRGHKLVFTHPGDSFSITLSTAMIFGAVIASPVIIYQLWAFLSPALYRNERRLVIPVILGAVLLFVAGVALAWFFVLPMTLKFLMNFQVESLEPMITASEYFSLVTILALTMGAVFELPLLILALAALGLVTPQFLSRFRKYALVLSYVVAAFITPGDLFITTLALTVPLYLLYELSVMLAYIVFRKRRAATNYSAEQSTAGGVA